MKKSSLDRPTWKVTASFEDGTADHVLTLPSPTAPKFLIHEGREYLRIDFTKKTARYKPGKFPARVLERRSP